MPLNIMFPWTTGATLKATLQRESDGHYWSEAAGAWQSAPSFANKSISLTEGSSENLKTYTGANTGDLGDAMRVQIRIHDTGAGNATVGVGSAYVLGGNEVTNLDAISNDAASADSLETMLNGTGGATLSLGQLVIDSSATSNPAISVTASTGTGLSVYSSGGFGATIIGDGAFSCGAMISGGASDGLIITSAADSEDVLAIVGSVMAQTTIATLASQTSFTLAAGSSSNDAYNGCEIIVRSAASKVQKCVGVVNDYAGSTKTVTLQTNPGVYTMAVGDSVTILASRALKPTVDVRTLDVSSGGESGVDWANVGTPGSTVNLSATTFPWNTAWNLYHADINIARDTANSQDEYTIAWLKNGVRITSGITSPLIQVVKRVDGTDLVASTAMTQIGSTGSYKYDEPTNRITAGEAVLIVVSATIDGSSRTFARVASRDS